MSDLNKLLNVNIFKVNHSFNVPYFTHTDDCDGDGFSYHESLSLSLAKDDIIFLSPNPEDKDLLILDFIERNGERQKLEYRTTLSIGFMLLNANNGDKLFTQIPVQIYIRDHKLNTLIA